MPKKKKAVKKKAGKKMAGMSKGSGHGRPPRSPEDQLLSCVGRLAGWLQLYGGRLASALACYQQYEPGLAAWPDLSLCLTAMEAPVTPSDLPLLRQLLDTQDSGLVGVASLHSDLLAHQRRLTVERGVVREAEVCASCGLRLPPPPAEDSTSFVDLHMILAPFASTAAHPSHTTFLLPVSTTIQALQHRLHSTLGAMATTVAVFSDVKVQPSNRLHPKCSLEEVGVAGGTRATPTQATLYYDYRPVALQCPLLMADHYFHHIPLSPTPSTAARTARPVPL